jgi:hypothetical protein
MKSIAIIDAIVRGTKTGLAKYIIPKTSTNRDRMSTVFERTVYCIITSDKNYAI